MFLNQLLEFILYKIKGRSIEWDHQNIVNYFIFRYNFRENANFFDEAICLEILEKAVKTIDTMHFSFLASLSHSTSPFYPSYHEIFRQNLIDRLKDQTRFDHHNLFTLGFIIRGLGDLRSSNPIPESTLPASFELLKDEILRKFQSIGVTNWSMYVVADGIRNIVGPAKDEIQDCIIASIENTLESKTDLLDDTSNFLLCNNLIHTISCLDPGLVARDVLRKTASSIFLQYFINSDKFSTTVTSSKKVFVRSYLRACEKFNVFQVCYLDLCVVALHQMCTSQGKFVFDALMPCISSLVHLNYHDRFGGEQGLDFAPAVKQSWLMILDFVENSILASSEILNRVDEDEDFDTTGYDKTIGTINYLWALCAMDLYSPIVVNSLMQSLNISRNKALTKETVVKLFQIYYWLKYEKSDQIYFNEQILEIMNELKKKWDSEDHVNTEYDEIKDIVRRKLEDQGVNFRENVSDFPFFFDFVRDGENSGIIVESDKESLVDTEYVYSGLNKVYDRQYRVLGWRVNKLSIQQFVKGENIQLFSNS